MKTDKIASDVVAAFREKGLTLATAESCTGGGVGHAVTAVSGSSSVYLGGIVSYANAVKENVLKVPAATLQTKGAVSEETAYAMAIGARELIGADVVVSITGIAGPLSDDTKKPVGLVYIGVATEKGVVVKENHFDGDRESVREQSICTALAMILENIKKEGRS